METETAIKPSTSFDVFALSPQGYEIHVQLAGDRAYTSALKLLETMSKDGFTARPMHNGYSRARGTGAPRTNGAGLDEQQLCPTHKVPMRRHENDKGTWYSHKLADGTWCNGKAA